jgi:hypothetical protein
MNFPTRDWVTTKLLDIEADVHRQGWDQPALLGVLCDIPDDRPGMAILPFDNSDKPLGVYLYVLGKTLLQAPADVLKPVIAEMPNPVALVLIAEVWTTETPAEDRGGRRIADLPGNTEERTVNAVDLLGRQYFIMRQRGKEPVDALAQEGTTLDGLTPAALRNILLALTRQLPGFQHSVQLLESLTFTQAP